MIVTPMEKKEVPADIRKVGKDSTHLGVAGVVEIPQTTQTQTGKMGLTSGSKGDVTQGATPDYRAPWDQGDPRDWPEGRETRSQPQGWLT